uniref:Uncharacterized protein n=1 Tax=Megaselia scalaris TaxID=36166 RepID=T1GLA0_MEGSC
MTQWEHVPHESDKNILKYEEDQILKEKNVTNDELFFVFYGQNFCHFGKEIAEMFFIKDLDKIGIISTKFTIVLMKV